jgi:hypothetical protein
MSGASESAKMGWKDKVISNIKAVPKNVWIGMFVIFVIATIAIIATNTDMMSGMTSKFKSPDGKLINKNHTDKARRSDSKNDNWSKKDFLKSVATFNKMAALNA